MPPPQEPVTRRRFVKQHMHCDIMYVNKKAVLVSRTEPVGVVLCACIENATAKHTPIFRDIRVTRYVRREVHEWQRTRPLGAIR
jgi:hypothetical protein